MTDFNLVVLASCGGGNFEKLVLNKEKYDFNILKLISEKDCGAIDKAINHNIPYEIIDKKVYRENFFTELDSRIPINTDLIVLAGFMPILNEWFCKKWNGKIINTHPSLLPKYGGIGMYGVKVQEAVMANKEKYAGCTIHYVTEKIDGGEIILQKKIKVDYKETPWQLGGRIFEEEGALLLEAIEKIKQQKFLPKVSICCITYNHAKYIRQALDSFLMQKTNFPYEVLIHDDASTDGTTEIIKEYENKYPEIIKPIYQKENQFSKGVSISKTFNFPRVKGKYVALCEGDDYWTDENKLQKQVDFMDANPDYTICFHDVKRIFEISSQENDIYPTAATKQVCPLYDFNNLLHCNFIQTNSVMYRWDAVKNVCKNFPDNILPGDWYLHLMFAKEGKIKHLPEVMSVYRINSGGIWSQSYSDREQFFLKIYARFLNFSDAVCKNLEKNSNRSKDVFLKHMEIVLDVLKKHKKLNTVRLLMLKYWDYRLYRKIKYNKLFIRVLWFILKFH